MSDQDVVLRLFAALEARRFDDAAAVIDPDVKIAARTLGRDAMLAIDRALVEAFPDLSYGVKLVRVEGSMVHVSTRLVGTHRAELRLPSFLPAPSVVPTTCVRIDTGVQILTFEVAAGRIVTFWADDKPRWLRVLEELGAARLA
jgi:hypothetical protein